MADDRLERAIALVQSGKMEDARELLELVLKEDRNNIPAWHWYAETWQKANDKMRVWEVCLRYNPTNELAQEALKDLKFIQSEKAIPETILPAGVVRTQTRASQSQWLVWIGIGLLTGIAIFAWVTVRNSAPKDPEPYKHTQPVEYYLYAPKAYSADQEWPLFVGIHGAGGSGLDCWNLWQSYADKEEFILLCPSIPGNPDGFYYEVGESTVWSAVGQVKKDYRIRPRMFLSGFSAGAFFVQGFVYRYPQYVSGVSILSAGSYDKINLNSKDVPFLIVIGNQDHPFSVEQSGLFAQYLEQEGFDVQYALLPGIGHAVTRDGVNLTIELFRKIVNK